MEASLGEADDESVGDDGELAGCFAGPGLHAPARQATIATAIGRDVLTVGLLGFRCYKLFRK